MTDRGVPRFPSFVRVRTDVAQPKVAVPSPTRSKQVQPKPKPSETAMKRYFEFIEGSSSKFWEISQSGKDVTVRFGQDRHQRPDANQDPGRRRCGDQARREAHQGEDRQRIQGDSRP